MSTETEPLGAALVRANPLSLPGTLQTLKDNNQLTATRLVVDDPEIQYDDFEQIAADIGSFRDAVGLLNDMTKFWAGDLMVTGLKLYGDDAHQAFEALNLKPGVMQEWLRVARLVLPDQRKEGVSWSHHRAVATRPAEEQERLLQTAVEGSLSLLGFQDYIRDLDAELEKADKDLSADDSETRFETAIVVEHLIETARRIYHQAQRTPDGVLVPAEPWEQFAAALGEGE